MLANTTFDYISGLYMSDLRDVAPPISQEGEYVEFLIQFIKKNSIDVLIPTIDSELMLMSRSRKLIESESNVKIIIGSEQDMMICSDKLATSRYLTSKGINQPKTLTVADKDTLFDFLASGSRILMKPRFGGGSKGIRLLVADDLNDVSWLDDNFIYQNFDVYSKEFTSVVMKDDSTVVSMAVFERELIGGRTMWCKRVPVQPFEQVLQTVAEDLDVPYLNIQFGMVDNSMKLFDINPRFSGSTGVFSLLFNGPHLLAQKFFTGVMPNFPTANHYFESVRSYEDLIL